MGDAKIPEDWTGEYCTFSVCWPNSPEWLGVLRGVLSIPQEGRFWDETTGNVKDTQNIIEKTFDYNFNNWEVIMACGDNGVATALLAIATALTNSNSSATAIANCGGGGGGGGTFVSNQTVSIQGFVTLNNGVQWPIMGTQPIAKLPESGYPDGYNDLEAYDVDKCRKANKMADDFIQTLRNIALGNWVTGVIGAAVIIACLVGLITVPYVVVPTLLFALTANIGITAFITEFANQLESHKSEFVCILYEGDTVEIIITQLAEFFDIVIALIEAPEAIAAALLSIALWLMNGDTLNALFSSVAAGVYPDADCSECEPSELTLYYSDANDNLVPVPGFVWGEECSFTAPTNAGNGFRYLQLRFHPSNRFTGWDEACIVVSDIDAGDTGHCSNSTVPWVPGQYGPESPAEDLVMFNFGCSNTYPMSITFTAYKPGECPE